MDVKPCDGKLSRTVWGGGKLGDDIKELPIVKSVYPTGNCGGGTHKRQNLYIYRRFFYMCGWNVQTNKRIFVWF